MNRHHVLNQAAVDRVMPDVERRFATNNKIFVSDDVYYCLQ